jgi:hypothetical protein
MSPVTTGSCELSLKKKFIYSVYIIYQHTILRNIRKNFHGILNPSIDNPEVFWPKARGTRGVWGHFGPPGKF